jgi:predicted nucleotide-binding protein
MARKQRETKAPVESIALRVPRAEAAEKIQRQINEGEELLGIQPGNEEELDEFREKRKVWSDYNAELLKTLFTTPEISEEYSRAYGGVFSMTPTFQEQVGYVYEDIQDYQGRLRSIHRRLELYPSPEGERNGAAPKAATERGSDVFLVHGHDDAAKETAARFLERFDLNVIILHEQPNLGRTIIEKFEDYTNVGYAVVLLTPDDVGRGCDEKTEQSRSRQNVILELGYFLGVLGRTRVCALKTEGVEVPSDLSGVLYVLLDDAGTWRLKLATEIRGAGIEIDLNKVM